MGPNSAVPRLRNGKEDAGAGRASHPALAESSFDKGLFLNVNWSLAFASAVPLDCRFISAPLASVTRRSNANRPGGGKSLFSLSVLTFPDRFPLLASESLHPGIEPPKTMGDRRNPLISSQFCDR